MLGNNLGMTLLFQCWIVRFAKSKPKWAVIQHWLTSLFFAIQADMAPRKRTTRQQKNDPRIAKLEAFLQDFDSESK